MKIFLPVDRRDRRQAAESWKSRGMDVSLGRKTAMRNSDAPGMAGSG
jgi:hypothetical protein